MQEDKDDSEGVADEWSAAAAAASGWTGRSGIKRNPKRRLMLLIEVAVAVAAELWF